MNDIYMASCPVCGRSLFKGKADSYIEGGCPKCKNYLIISFTDNGFTATVSEKSPTEMNVTTKLKDEPLVKANGSLFLKKILTLTNTVRVCL